MSALRKTAWAVAVALLPALTAAPATAAAKAGTKDEKAPKPPAVMSTVGGAQLGRPGTQVRLAAGAPVLPKEVTGRSWIVADAESGEVLAAHNAHWRLPPASTLKMLFADTVLPKLSKDQQHTVTRDELAGVGVGSSLVGIKENQTYSVHDLWLGVFLRSGNDAVHVLSEMNGGIPRTVQEMQEHAEELQALDTRVVTPDGYDEKGQVSSAYDLTLIARSGLQKKDFREYCATARAQFPGEQKPGKKRESFQIQNTNRLLTGDFGVAPYQGMAGVKNGTTTLAGSTFTGVAERDGKVLLVTVMNPASKEGHAVYKETARLLDWGFAAAGKVEPVGELVPPRSADTGSSGGSGDSGGAATGDSDGPASGGEKGGKDGRDGEERYGPDEASAASRGGTTGAGVAVSVAIVALVLLAVAGFLVNRRWPLPDLARRRPRR
ncbi:D-alanyl-D-alanine carboxypeptidase family protein [Streptomyces tirandamycinicus]|uniref:D-alanyl-D-alanine carboxypeptidase family protein n=1 Tax=Streptomyces tirandamycinicus TaxID=2174846 RepID=UPI002D1E4513|nr:D-alanyl-D-alanine carboxypeptidase [Streptomyces tirandamycinicus]